MPNSKIYPELKIRSASSLQLYHQLASRYYRLTGGLQTDLRLYDIIQPLLVEYSLSKPADKESVFMNNINKKKLIYQAKSMSALKESAYEEALLTVLKNRIANRGRPNVPTDQSLVF